MKRENLDLLRPIWMSRSFISDEKCSTTLKEWLIDGNYYINNNNPDLSIYCQEINELKKCLSVDAFRFSAHAAQTAFELERTSAYPNLTSWRVIQAYYASYFAAHAIIRFLGVSFSYLEYGHIKFLSERCYSEVGYKPKIFSAYYIISLAQNSSNLSFDKREESHRDLWKCFLSIISQISSELLGSVATKSRREDLSQAFSELANTLTDRGRQPAGNWLSLVRNEVNYKSSHGVWFPFSKNNPRFDDLMAKIGDWRNCNASLDNPSRISNDLERYFVTTFFIVDIALSIAKDYQSLSEKAGPRSSHFSRLLKLSAAA